MQDGTQQYIANRRLESKYGLTFWGLALAGTALNLFVVTQTAKLPKFKSNADFVNYSRLAAGVLAIGGCIAAKAMLPDYEEIQESNRLSRGVLSHNRAAFINLLTQPTRKLFSQTDSATESPVVEIMPLWDWAEFKDADKFPTICVFGPMGSGKSIVMQWLARHVIGATSGAVFDIHCNEWAEGLSVKTDITAMVELMQADLIEVDRLRRLSVAEKKALPQQVRILDEAPDTIAEIRLALEGDKENAKLYDRWFMKMATVVRKLKIRTLVGSVVIAADDLGISASKRNTMTVIFPGVQGVGLAMKDTAIFKLGSKENKALRDSLLNSLHGVKRPALVFENGNWHPASIPDLDDYGNPIEGVPQVRAITPAQRSEVENLKAKLERSGNQPEDVRARLEALLDLPVEHPTESMEDAIVRWGEDNPGMDLDVLLALAKYCQSKGEISIREVGSNWGRHKGFDRTATRELIDALCEIQLVEIDDGCVVWCGG